MASAVAAHLIAFLPLLPWSVAIQPATDMGTESQGCDVWLAPSALPGAGYGVFAGRAFEANEAIDNSSAVLVSRATKESTQLQNYVFKDPSSLPLKSGHSKQSVFPLGLAAMVNHGAPHQVNAELIPNSKGHFAVLRAIHPIAPGTEVLISYGTAEWFLLRDIPYTDAPSSTMQPTQPLDRIHSSGACLSFLASQPENLGIVAQHDLVAGHVFQRPVLMLPRAAVLDDMTGLTYAHEMSDAVMLPLSLPGKLGCQEDSNIAYSLQWGDAANKSLQELCDSSTTGLSMQFTVLRSIRKGETLVANPIAPASGNRSCIINGSFPLDVAVFPGGQNRDSLAAMRHKLAEQGDVHAQFRLAQMLMSSTWVGGETRGSGTSWLERAAQGGHTWAQLRLGEAYATGNRVAKSASMARKWYTHAAQQGSATAEFRLGSMSLPDDQAGAASWFQKAASKGSLDLLADADAMNFLALAFIQGIGDIPANFTIAAKWLEKAAGLGLARAQHLLALAYDSGQGVEINKTAAIFWFERAAEQGHPGAKSKLLLAGRQPGYDMIPPALSVSEL